MLQTLGPGLFSSELSFFFLAKCHFCGPNQSNGNGSSLQLVNGSCEDVTRTNAEGEKWVRELGKTGHEPMKTIMMLMRLDLMYYISIQDCFWVVFF